MKKLIKNASKSLKDNYKFLIVFTLLVFFNFYNLAGDLFNADQHFWFNRTVNFVKAVQEGNWDETFQNPKPGVSVMILSGAGLEAFLSFYEWKYKFRPQLYTQDTYPYIDFVVKAPLVILGLFSYLVFYFVIRKTWGEKISLLSLILLGFSPYYTAINRLFHGDGTMNSFFLISVSLLIYFFYTKNINYLFFSGVAGGASFLAKSQAVFLIPYIFLISGLSFLILKNSIWESLKVLLFWILTFSISVYILFPAIWLKPLETINKIFSEGAIVASEGRNSGAGEENINNLFYYFGSVYNSNSLLFISLFLIGFYFFIQKYRSNDRFQNFALLSFASVAIFYFIQMSIVVQKSDRYVSVIYPFMAIFGAYGLSFLKLNFNKIFYSLLFISVLYLSYFAPYYLALFEKDSWGSLTREAANYLNTKEKSQNLNAIVVPKEHTFRPFFKGNTYSPSERIPKDKKPDYIVVGMNTNIPEKYSNCQFEKNIEFRGKIFWKVFNCSTNY